MTSTPSAGVLGAKALDRFGWTIWRWLAAVDAMVAFSAFCLVAGVALPVLFLFGVAAIVNGRITEGLLLFAGIALAFFVFEICRDLFRRTRVSPNDITAAE